MFHECCRIVADLSQNAEFLFCFCFVSLVWTRPKASKVIIVPRRTTLLKLCCSKYLLALSTRRSSSCRPTVFCLGRNPEVLLAPALLCPLAVPDRRIVSIQLESSNFLMTCWPSALRLTGVHLQEPLQRAQSLPVLACLLPAGTDPLLYSQVFCFLRVCDSECYCCRQY